MKTILVPTDFSPCALNALKYAVIIAETTGAEVHLLHALAMPANPNAGFLMGVDKLVSIQQDETEYKIKETLAHFAGLNIKTHVYIGDLIEGITHKAKEIQADLIVLGTEGDSGSERVFFSSFTVKAIGILQKPMLVIPDEASPVHPQVATYATDFDQDDFMAITEAQNLLSPLNIRLKALHIRKPNKPDHTLTGEFEGFFANRDIELIYKTSSDPEDGILGYMVDEKPDIVILLRRKRSFFGNLFSRSISKELAYVSHTPLLILCEK
jgi:nucleotide-binding universal stress UspA family protein